jgi:hypothetical protein
MLTVNFPTQVQPKPDPLSDLHNRYLASANFSLRGYTEEAQFQYILLYSMHSSSPGTTTLGFSTVRLITALQ